MSIDLARFHATFFEESREGLATMESGLLKLESGQADADTINAIFRAAHSIKGGAGTFGFHAIADFTHVLETLLDGMRAGRRPVDTASVEALLASVDVLRNLLHAAEHDAGFDAAAVTAVQQRLQALLDGKPVAAPAVAPTAVQAPAAATGWDIRFLPQRTLFQSGNDPLRILRELERLGPLRAQCHLDALPAFAQLDPFEAYLAWDLQLDGGAPLEQVQEAFAWVEDECELTIAPRAAAPAAPAPVAAESATPAAPAPAPAPAADTQPAPGASSTGGESSIRVNVAKLDALINLVGELVITQAMLQQVSGQLDPVVHEKLLAGLGQLERNTRDLQDAVMSVRMLPVDFVFSRFPRLARDLAGKLGKKIRLQTHGENTELDKSVIEKITDPLVHLVRNAIDHGIETPEVRRAAGKDETGTVALKASHQGGHVVIEIVDDGRGLDRARILAKAAERGLPVSEAMSDFEVFQLIFMPGFSTAEQITEISGRGVGMDVVRRNIVELGGDVQIDSIAGRGTRITIRLPLTLAILDGMSVAVGEETFIIPLNYVVESLQPAANDVHLVGGKGRVLRVRDEVLPLYRMHQIFGIGTGAREGERGLVVLLESDGRKLALEVDALVGQHQVVIKNLESNFRRVNGISGATIMGDGRVALIVDVGGLARSLSAAA